MKKIYKVHSIAMLLLVLLQPVFLISQSNQYLHFDREDDFVILNDAGQYVTGTTELSITGWFYCDEYAY